jgi:hypothetical protein
MSLVTLLPSNRRSRSDRVLSRLPNPFCKFLQVVPGNPSKDGFRRPRGGIRNREKRPEITIRHLPWKIWERDVAGSNPVAPTTFQLRGAPPPRLAALSPRPQRSRYTLGLGRVSFAICIRVGVGGSPGASSNLANGVAAEPAGGKRAPCTIPHGSCRSLRSWRSSD